MTPLDQADALIQQHLRYSREEENEFKSAVKAALITVQAVIDATLFPVNVHWIEVKRELTNQL